VIPHANRPHLRLRGDVNDTQVDDLDARCRLVRGVGLNAECERLGRRQRVERDERDALAA
jgi:hypothetical protein